MQQILLKKSTAQIYSVSQLNRETRLLLSGHFGTIQVEGEISNLSMPSSGHIYFSLKDAAAQIRCALFRSYKRQLPFTPKNGDQVIVTVQVGLYEARGDYQLLVENIHSAGDGALRRAFEALKNKLSEEGLFTIENKRTPPKLPDAVGIITSPTGAAVQDILSTLKRRFPALPVILYPVSVQGDSAKHEITNAIKTANQRNECDVIILARGGGSLEDLWAFNEEIVARAIFASKIPVVSGIGHETDNTIADFVADRRTPTPSSAAEHVSPNQQEYLRALQHYEMRLTRTLQEIRQQRQKNLDWIATRLQQQHPGKQLQARFQRLDEMDLRLDKSLRHQLQQNRQRIQILVNRLAQQHPVDRIDRVRLQLKLLSQKLVSNQHHLLERQKHRLCQSSRTLHTLSPLATLQRGYAIVSKINLGKIIHSTKQLHPGERVQTQLAEGRIISKIEEIEDV